jgi:hypothetical protein
MGLRLVDILIMVISGISRIHHNSDNSDISDGAFLGSFSHLVVSHNPSATDEVSCFGY